MKKTQKSPHDTRAGFLDRASAAAPRAAEPRRAQWPKYTDERSLTAGATTRWPDCDVATGFEP